MRQKITVLISCFIWLISCTKQPANNNLPLGITYLPEIDSTGLDYPIWSPNGKFIVMAYNTKPNPDFCFLGCPEPHSEIILIDTETWKASTILVQENYYVQLTALSWSPNSQIIAIYYWESINENGIYTIDIENTKPQFLMKDGELSHDWKKVITSISEGKLTIIDLQSHKQQEFALPNADTFRFDSWSPNNQQIALIQRKNEKDRFENIFLINLKSGELTQHTNDEKYFKYSAIFSPNGKNIAFIKWRFTDDGIEHIVVISRLDKSCEFEIPMEEIRYFTWSPDGKKMLLIGTDGVYLADLEVVFGENFISDIGCP